MDHSLYSLVSGSPGDKKHLLTFLRLTYQELFPHLSDFDHLQETVANYLTLTSPLWWIEARSPNVSHPNVARETVAGLWMGNALDQLNGQRYYHIFMLYVLPAHRRRGLAKHLLDTAQNYSRQRGDRQMGLQVFLENQGALKLYEGFGFRPQALMMIKAW